MLFRLDFTIKIMASRAGLKGQRWADLFVRQIIRTRSDNDQLDANNDQPGADICQIGASKMSTPC